MKFALETISTLSDRPGPIDPKTGWPTHRFVVEAESQAEAEAHFNKEFPGDVLAVFCIDD